MFLAKRTPGHNRRHFLAPIATDWPVDIAVQSTPISDFDSDIVLSNHVSRKCASAIPTLVPLAKSLFARIEALVAIFTHLGRLDSQIGDLKSERHDCSMKRADKEVIASDLQQHGKEEAASWF